MESGTIVEFIDQQKIVIGAVLDVKQKRVRLLSEANREVVLSEGRLLQTSHSRIETGKGRDHILHALKESAFKREQLKEKIDIRELWELLNEENEWIDLKTMSEYCFSDAITPDHESAVIRSFFNNRIYFKFNNQQFFPHSKEQVELILAQKQEEERRKRLIEDGGDFLKAAFQETRPVIPDEMREIIEIVQSYYVFEKESKTAELAKAILSHATIDLNDQVFRFLVRAGFWHEDENLDLLRLEIQKDFSKRVEAHAETLSPLEITGEESSRRRDLTGLDVMTIDGEMTKDFDDALSIQKENGHYIVGIHIIDVDCYIRKGDILDQCGLNRGSSIYMPDLTIPMLPRLLSEDILSLRQGELRPCISTLIRLNRFFEIIDFEIIPSIIRVNRQLSYHEVSRMIETEEDMNLLFQCAKTFREKRIKSGAVQITLPDLSISLSENGGVTVSLEERESASRMLVSELMIMANWMSARFLADHGVPAIFRSQPEPKARLYPGESDSLFLNYMQRKQVSRVIIGAEPEHHSGLGVNAYVTCTSPIRRYFDLVTQRQIKSILDMNAPYTKEEILSVYQTLDQTIASVYKAQYLRQRYFLLKHLEQRKGEKTDAIVLEKRKDGYFALLKEYIIECKLPGKGLKLNPQETIQVVIQHADPRKDLLSVFPG